MNKKTADKLVQAIKRMDDAIRLCETNDDAFTIRDLRWQVNDLISQGGFDVIEDSRGYHAVKQGAK
jgi:hypothetical protein